MDTIIAKKEIVKEFHETRKRLQMIGALATIHEMQILRSLKRRCRNLEKVPIEPDVMNQIELAGYKIEKTFFLNRVYIVACDEEIA